MSKTKLGQWDKRILMQAMATRCLDLFERLESESKHLDMMDYFDKYYRQLYVLVYCMELYYPSVDLSTNDVDLLYERLHINDK